jgi:WD40 repeat protein
VALSADGKRIVSGSWDKTLKIWDADQGQELLTLKGQANWFTCVALSADNKRIVSGSGGRHELGKPVPHDVKIWEADKGQEVHSLKGHTNSVICLALSADGKRIVSGSDDDTLKIWDADKGQEDLSINTHVRCMALSADGKRIVSGNKDNTLKIWEADTGQEVRCLKGHMDKVLCVALSADGKRIVSGSSDKTLARLRLKPTIAWRWAVWDNGSSCTVQTGERCPPVPETA